MDAFLDDNAALGKLEDDCSRHSELENDSKLYLRWRLWFTPLLEVIINCAKPDLNYLEKNFSSAKINVTQCNKREFNTQPCYESVFGDFVSHWKDHSASTGGFKGPTLTSHALSNDPSCALIAREDMLDKLISTPSFDLYCRDWHFARDFPLYCAYSCPVQYSQDWLNEFWDYTSNEVALSSHSDATRNDYRFVYAGPQGVWTPLHRDVFRSYSWSSNVVGCKLWVLIPPALEHLVNEQNSPVCDFHSFFDREEVVSSGFADSLEKWDQIVFQKRQIVVGYLKAEIQRRQRERLGEAIRDQSEKTKTNPITTLSMDSPNTIYFYLQMPGDALYVPAGWSHQVCNISDAISINHNWVNGDNTAEFWYVRL